MKVKYLFERMSKLNPDDDICALVWTKPYYDDPNDVQSGEGLTDDAWTEICTEFDEWPEAGKSISDWLVDAVSEKAQL